jgi:hypothetical protein
MEAADSSAAVFLKGTPARKTASAPGEEFRREQKETFATGRLRGPSRYLAGRRNKSEFLGFLKFNTVRFFES